MRCLSFSAWAMRQWNFTERLVFVANPSCAESSRLSYRITLPRHTSSGTASSNVTRRICVECSVAQTFTMRLQQDSPPRLWEFYSFCFGGKYRSCVVSFQLPSSQPRTRCVPTRAGLLGQSGTLSSEPPLAHEKYLKMFTLFRTFLKCVTCRVCAGWGVLLHKHSPSSGPVRTRFGLPATTITRLSDTVWAWTSTLSALQASLRSTRQFFEGLKYLTCALGRTL